MSTQQQIDKLIAVRAAEFFEAIRAGELETSADEFRLWISESPKHVDAFMTISGQAPLVREVLKSQSVGLSTLLCSKPAGVVHLDRTPAPLESSVQKALTAKTSSRSRSPTRWVSLAAALALAAIILWLALPRWQRLETAAGEQRTVTLADGSVVNLNAQSLVEIRLREHARDLRLLRGEAIFKVAHDVSRPFNVRTSSAVVRAVGTEFAVSVRNEATAVTVLEGKVEVTASARDTHSIQANLDRASVNPPARVTAVSAGQAARVVRSGTVEFEPKADVATSIAWLQRKLVFRGSLIEDMVLEINRYNQGVQLHVEDLTPGKYRFSGTFDANDPLSLADLLGREPGLSVERRGNDIYIRETKATP